MKKIYLVFSLAVSFSFFTNNVKAQCPGCVSNTACVITPAYPTTCPLDTMPDAFMGQPYNEDITFYMPEYFDVTSPVVQTVHLDELIIMNVSGLPSGLNWETNNSPGNNYYPSPGNEHGCAKVCGTAQFPGTYNVTIYFQVTVTPQSIGGVTTQNESMGIVLIVKPNPSGNSAFITANAQGCEPHSTGFSPVVTSGGNSLYTYSWDFGNGNNSTSENPPVQNYLTPGSYIVNQTTNVSAYELTDVYFNVGSNTNWCGDAEEPYFLGCTGDPDLFFELRDNSSVVVLTSSEIGNSMTATWSNLTTLLQNGPYTIQFWDMDAVSVNDNLGIFPISPTATGTFNFNGGGVSGNYTIGTQIINTVTGTDTIVVYPFPPALPITVSPNDSVCKGDSITLTVDGGYNYQWYKDTALLFNAVDSFIVINDVFNNNYWVKVSNQYGCTTNSLPVEVFFVDNPPKPNFWLAGNTLNNNLSGFDLQWYENNAPIPGATGSVITVTNAYYHLIATNSFGCSTSSDTLLVSPGNIGIEEQLSEQDIKVYPNPNNGQFTIAFDLVHETDITILIADFVGKIVYHEKLEKQQGNYNRQLNLSSLSKGMYLLNLQLNNQQIKKKIIIQ